MKRTLCHVLIGVSICSLSGCGQMGLVKGSSAPDFRVEGFDKTGSIVKLSDFKGKVVLLDFWATWCGPCRVYSPEVEKLHRKYAAKDLQIMAITDEPKDVISRFRNEESITYPMFIDVVGSAHNAYRITAIPTTYVVDRKGNLVYAKGDADPMAIEDAILKSL